MYQATFRVRDRGPYAEATAADDARIELWCNDHCDLLHVKAGDGDAALDLVAAEVGITEELVQGDHRVVITDECLKHHDPETIEDYLVRHGCLLVPPLTYTGGAKHVRILALDSATLSDIYQDLAEDYAVTVVEKHELTTPPRQSPMNTMESTLPDLTARQRDVLRAAYDAGYYRIPRDVTTAELAETFDLDRRTVEEHLRRAENKLLGALVDQGTV